jgi:hypothetical protein
MGVSMSPSEAKDFLTFWDSEVSKTFVYNDGEFIKNEYLKIVKYYDKEGNIYLIDGSSTYFPNNKLRLTEEELIKMLTKKHLEVRSNFRYDSPRTLKTGGCECGAYVLKDNTYLHSKWCPMHKRDPGEWT